MVLISILMLVSFGGIANADSPEITSVNVYSNFHETDDWLIVVTTNVSEAPFYPYYRSADYWSLQLRDATNTTVASVALWNWGMKPSSIYLSEAQASSLTWGAANYSMIVVDNYDSTNNGSIVINSSDWKGDSSTSLAGWIRGQAAAIGQYDETDATYYLITDAEYGQVLTLEGGTMFALGVPYLDTYLPTLFAIRLQTLGEYTGLTGGTTYADSLDDWETAVGADFHAVLDDAGTLFHLDGKWIGGLGFAIMAIALMAGGVAFGASSAGIMGGSVLICVGALMGFIPLVLIFIPAIILSLMFVRSFWWVGV